jgi:hypothetical protein
MPRTHFIMVWIFVSMATVLLHPSVGRTGAVTSGLIAYWPLDEANIKDEIVEDVWGESHGEIKGDPEVGQGKVGEALLLDGDMDCVLIDSEVIRRDYSEMTLECWVFINALDDSWNRILSIDDTDFGNQNVVTLYYDDDDNQHGFFLRAEGESCDVAEDMVQEDIAIGEWLHIMGVWDGKTVKYYENGKLEKESSLSGTVQGGDLLCGIGDRADGENADTVQGLIDEVRVYERALSGAEVQQNFKAEGLAVESANAKLAHTWGEIKALR